MTPDPDDAELIALSLDGDENAFVEVVRRHEAAVGAWPAGGEIVETLIIDAGTGQPVAVSSKAPDQPLRTIYYHASRVTLADIKAGRF
ncbi:MULTISPECIES: hypothetical protein [unclassified Spirillospora]|uniref:hypothetical protein n=1 Tax=unclassified Spirillospora TaxID=2642701 RepID=UPI0037161C0D